MAQNAAVAPPVADFETISRQFISSTCLSSVNDKFSELLTPIHTGIVIYSALLAARDLEHIPHGGVTNMLAFFAEMTQQNWVKKSLVGVEFIEPLKTLRKLHATAVSEAAKRHVVLNVDEVYPGQKTVARHRMQAALSTEPDSGARRNASISALGSLRRLFYYYVQPVADFEHSNPAGVHGLTDATRTTITRDTDAFEAATETLADAVDLIGNYRLNVHGTRKLFELVLKFEAAHLKLLREEVVLAYLRGRMDPQSLCVAVPEHVKTFCEMTTELKNIVLATAADEDNMYLRTAPVPRTGGGWAAPAAVKRAKKLLEDAPKRLTARLMRTKILLAEFAHTTVEANAAHLNRTLDDVGAGLLPADFEVIPEPIEPLVAPAAPAAAGHGDGDNDDGDAPVAPAAAPAAAPADGQNDDDDVEVINDAAPAAPAVAQGGGGGLLAQVLAMAAAAAAAAHGEDASEANDGDWQQVPPGHEALNPAPVHNEPPVAADEVQAAAADIPDQYVATDENAETTCCICQGHPDDHRFVLCASNMPHCCFGCVAELNARRMARQCPYCKAALL